MVVKILENFSLIYYYQNILYRNYLCVFEKYIFEISIRRFKIKVIKLAINIGKEEILYP